MERLAGLLKTAGRTGLVCALLSGLPWVASGCGWIQSKLSSKLSGGGSSRVPSATYKRVSTPEANAELLGEIVNVVFLKDPASFEGFSEYLAVLNQGASLEGLYNGFTHSSEYRKLEQELGAIAAEGAVEVFAAELEALERDLKPPTTFDARSPQPLDSPVQLSLQPLPSRSMQGLEGAENPAPVSKPNRVAYRQLFLGASLFTLKRILADEALKIVAQKRSDRSALASWYSGFAVRLSSRRVNFGLALRSKPDGNFHRAWAEKADLDLLTWEVLNRIHRLLNAQLRK